MNYRLTVVRVFTRDWARAVRFYRDTLGMREKLVSETMGWAEFDVGGVSLALENLQDEGPEEDGLAGRFVGVSLAVDDIHETCEKLRARGVNFTGPPTRQPWGGILAHFEDLDGNVLTLLGEAHG